jgi:TfoX/Sxy family transcriptional regulator of competence genes
MRKKATTRTPDDLPASFEPVVAAFAGDKQVACGSMFSSNAVLNVNGKIFAMQVKGKLVVKLPRQRVDELVVSGKGKYFDPGHGKLMKEWAAIDSPEAEWVALAKEAYNFVKSRKSSRAA